MADNNNNQKPANPDFTHAIAQAQEAIPFIGQLATDIDVAFCNATNDYSFLPGGQTNGCQLKRDIVANRR